MSPNEEYVANLTELLSKLGEALDRETKLISTRRVAEIDAFRAERERLSAAYERQIAHVRANPTLVRTAPPATVARLKDAMARFHDLLNEHRRAVFAAKTLTERLIGSLADELTRRDRPVGGYTRTAALRVAPPRSARPISLALNQVV